MNTFPFRMEGEKLTGMVAGSQDQSPIKDGKVSGVNLSFTADRPFGSFAYKGQISGGEIRFPVEFNGNTFETTARRVE